MKKSIIWLLTVLMALTAVVLLYIQIMYMESMIRMRDDQFSEGVRRSLYAVSSLLEQDETKYFLEEDVAQVEASSIYAQYGGAPHLGGIKYSFTTRSGLEGDVTLKADAEKIYKIQSETVRSSSVPIPWPCAAISSANLRTTALSSRLSLPLSTATATSSISRQALPTSIRPHLKTVFSCSRFSVTIPRRRKTI